MAPKIVSAMQRQPDGRCGPAQELVHSETMSVTVEISSDLAPLLEAEAFKAGKDPSAFAQQLLRSSLRARRSPRVPQIPLEEEELIKAINRGPKASELERYEDLIRKRQDEDLRGAEFDELCEFTDRMEEFAVERLACLAKLAELRGVDLQDLMADLEIRPPDVL